ncbi:MAG TPA: hypothetical protein VI299_21060 [Polyangiales bacterium]
MSAASALTWTARLLAWSLFLQAVEWWQARSLLRASFPWHIVRRDYGVRFEDRAWPGLVLAQAVLAIALALSDAALWPWSALVLALLHAARFRGNYNGGSDAMTLVVLLGLAIGRTFSAPAGLGYITAQLVLSYFLAGCWKLRDRAWRDGSALERLLALPQYRSTPLVVPGTRWLGYGVLAFECAFPLALFGLALPFAALGITFHAVNARVLGLNRFLWAWLAAYPALFYWSGLLSPR